jgi:hypothetical protein
LRRRSKLPEPEPFYFESKVGFESCCDGGMIKALGTAESPPPWRVRQTLGYCLNCEHWSWAGSVELTRPVVCFEQGLRIVEELRTKVLFELWQPTTDPFEGRVGPFHFGGPLVS